MNSFKRFTRVAGWLFITASAAAFLLYFGMKALIGHSSIEVFVPFAHFTSYYDFYPVPYLLAIALVFAVVSALWLVFIMPRFTWLRFAQIMLLPWIALVFAGPMWGMLWVYHDMQAGFFPAFRQMMDYLLFGARQGLFFALNSALFSVPFNLLAYGTACLLLTLCIKRFVSEQPKRAQLRGA